MFESSLDMDGKLLNELTLELLSVMALQSYKLVCQTARRVYFKTS
jgi:hypothetical protein